MDTLFLVVMFVLILGFFKTVTGYERHGYVGSKLMKAWHVSLPGYNEICYPEQNVELQDWIGTQWSSLKAVDSAMGEENPEVTAGLALRALGLYTDFGFKRRGNGHYILHRPAKSEKHFVWNAYYRIGPWRKA